MRHDLFYDKKSIHIKLTKESHTALREKLFRYGVTMQDLFQDTADIVLSDTPRAEKLLQRVAKKKLAASLEKLGRGQRAQLGELDSETLYNLLEDENDNNRQASGAGNAEDEE